MNNNDEINRRLKYELYGRSLACFIMLIIVAVFSIKDARNTNSEKVQSELDDFKASQPNYADSIRAYDAKNADEVAHLKNILDFLNANQMPRVNRDSLNKVVADFDAGRKNLVNAKTRTDSVLKAHLDSVRRANKYNILVRNSAMRYSK